MSGSSNSNGGGLVGFMVVLFVAGGFYFLSKDPASVIPVGAPADAVQSEVAEQVPAMRDQFFLESSKTPGFTTFYDQQYLFHIDYPEGWELQTPMFDLVAAMFFAPQDDASQDFFVNVNVTVDDIAKYGGLSLQDYSDQALVQLKQVFPNYELLDQGPRNLGPIDGHYMVASYAEGETTVEIFSIFAFTEERIYALTYSYLPDQKELSESLVDHMVESFGLL